MNSPLLVERMKKGTHLAIKQGLDISETWAADAIDLTIKMLDVNPDKRITVENALKHHGLFLFKAFLGACLLHL